MIESERHHLIPARKVEGAAVYGSHRQRLGSISNVIIDKSSGLVAYVDLTVGGVFGLGGHHHRVRWDALHYDPQIGGYFIDAELDQLPEFEEDPEVGGHRPTQPVPTAYDTSRRHWL